MEKKKQHLKVTKQVLPNLNSFKLAKTTYPLAPELILVMKKPK